MDSVERLQTAKFVLLTLSDRDLAEVERSLPLIRRVVRMFDDRQTSYGLADLDSEDLVAATVKELGTDLESLLGDERP